MTLHSISGFSRRHIGIQGAEAEEMLQAIGFSSLDQLIDKTVPQSIRMSRNLNIHSMSMST